MYHGKYLTDGYSYHKPYPNADCEGYLVEIDELMINPIRDLNNKGYITEFCCSGHVYSGSLGGYIMFDEEVFKTLGFNKDTFDPPKGWKFEEPCTIRYCLNKNDSDLKRTKDIFEHITALMEWVNELEPLEC